MNVPLFGNRIFADGIKPGDGQPRWGWVGGRGLNAMIGVLIRRGSFAWARGKKAM